MEVNIYIDNHGKQQGIEDFLEILEKIFQSRGYDVVITRELKTDVINIIIDEFTNALANKEILAFKRQNPSAKIVLLLTEFIETKWLVTSFNFFGNIFQAAALAALNVYIRQIRKDFPSPSFRDWFVGIIYVPILLGYLANHFIRKGLSSRRKRLSLRRRLSHPAYMLMRYLGLKKMISSADCIVLSHEMIASGLNKISEHPPIIGTIYPEIDSSQIKAGLFKNKDLYIEISGSVTPYRKKIIDEINSDILVLGLKNLIGKCKVSSFMTEEQKESHRGAYSLHPPQTKQWKYCSPTRIYRALQFRNNIPILTRKFNQHPIEELCFEYKGADSIVDLCQHYKHPENLIANMENAMRNYEVLARQKNDAVTMAIREKFRSANEIGK